MELIELDATAQRALELLTNAGMSDGSIYDYTHTGFGSILRHFHTNAQQFIKIQESYGSFDSFIWSYVDGKPILNQFQTETDIPARTALSDQISKDLKELGFKFVGSTIIYAYMQAIGIVNDHVKGCHLYANK